MNELIMALALICQSRQDSLLRIEIQKSCVAEMLQCIRPGYNQKEEVTRCLKEIPR